MSALRKAGSTPTFWVGAIVLATLAIALLVRPSTGRTDRELRSSFRTSPDGVAALFRSLERFGVNAAPRLTPLVEADPVRGTIVLLEPVVFPSPREARALLHHVRAGGTLLYAPRARTSLQEFGRMAVTPLMDSLGIEHRFNNAYERLTEATFSDPVWEDHPLTDGLPSAHRPRHVISLNDEEGETTDLLTAESTDGRRDYGAEWSVVSEIGMGAGRVVVFAESAGLSNGEAAEDPLAALFVRAAVAYTEPADTVFFDEYHLGIGTLRSRAEIVTGFFTGSPGGRALLQLLLIGALALACAGLRFGSPTPAVAPPDRERRSPLEHADALGDLYRKSGASRTAGLLLVSRLARVSRLSPPRNRKQARELLDRVDRRGDVTLDSVKADLHASKPDLVRMSAGIDKYIAWRNTK